MADTKPNPLGGIETVDPATININETADAFTPTVIPDWLGRKPDIQLKPPGSMWGGFGPGMVAAGGAVPSAERPMFDPVTGKSLSTPGGVPAPPTDPQGTGVPQSQPTVAELEAQLAAAQDRETAQKAGIKAAYEADVQSAEDDLKTAKTEQKEAKTDASKEAAAALVASAQARLDAAKTRLEGLK